MDHENNTPSPAEETAQRHIPTEAEIARAEAEAVAAMRRGESPAAGESSPSPAPEAPKPGFVPYVDDVPEPEVSRTEEEEDGEYIPGKWEKRIDALTPKQWKLCQIVGGAAVGLAAVASLFIFGEELSMYGMVVAALLVLLLPRYLERAWRRKLVTARYAMAAAMLVGLIAIGVVIGMRTGFTFKK